MTTCMTISTSQHRASPSQPVVFKAEAVTARERDSRATIHHNSLVVRASRPHTDLPDNPRPGGQQ